MASDSLIDRSHCRAFILTQAQRTRPGWACTRVSREALDTLNRKLLGIIVEAVHSHPTLGHTFKDIG